MKIDININSRLDSKVQIQSIFLLKNNPPFFGHEKATLFFVVNKQKKKANFTFVLLKQLKLYGLDFGNNLNLKNGDIVIKNFICPPLLMLFPKSNPIIFWAERAALHFIGHEKSYSPFFFGSVRKFPNLFLVEKTFPIESIENYGLELLHQF